MATSIKTFLEESRDELRKVNWLTREEATRYTLFVVGISLGFAVFLGALDFLFLKIIETIIAR